MSVIQVTDPPMLDATGQDIVTALNGIAGAVQNVAGCEYYKSGDSITFYCYCLLTQASSNGAANGYILMPKKMGSDLTISDSGVSLIMNDMSGSVITASAAFARYSDDFLRVTLTATSGITSSSFYLVRLNATLTFST